MGCLLQECNKQACLLQACYKSVIVKSGRLQGEERTEKIKKWSVYKISVTSDLI